MADLGGAGGTQGSVAEADALVRPFSSQIKPNRGGYSMAELLSVWVFNGDRSVFPSGVFRDISTAEQWIRKNSLSGCLTEYPLDIGIYDWAIQHGYFKPKHEHQRQPTFIEKFSSAALNHFHYWNGVEAPGITEIEDGSGEAGKEEEGQSGTTSTTK
jgi:hypothetical protein